MLDNRTTDENENPPLDVEDWELAFEPYIKDPGAALQLAVNLMTLKAYLTVVPFKVQEVIEGLDEAMGVLFLCTDLHDVSYDLFIRLTEGKLTFEEEQMLKALGINF